MTDDARVNGLDIATVRRRCGLREAAARLNLCLVGCLAIVASCSSSHAPQASPDAAPYLAHPQGRWELREAVEPAPSNPALDTEPSLRWWAEYEDPPEPLPGEGRAVRLSEHTRGVEALLDGQPGLSSEPTTVGSFDGRAATSSEGLAEILFVVGENRTVVVLSYQLSVDELRAWAERLRPLSARQWIAMGGTIDARR